MGVDVRRGGKVAVPQPLLNVFEGDAVGQQQAGTAVPLRYNLRQTGKAPYIKGFRLSGKVFHPFPNRKIEPRSSYIVGGVIVTTKIKYRLGRLSARPRNQDISSEKKKCPFFVPKIRCRQEEHNA